MARQLVLQNLMKLAQGIGANPQKFMGTRTNINFLGKGPIKNPLFQQPLDFLGPEGRGITAEALGDRGKLISAIEDAMGYATAGKLNPIQTEMLSGNLKGIYEILHPPVLPSASVTNIAPGIEGLRRFPKETHKFMGRPLKSKDFAEIDELVKRGKLPSAVDLPQKTYAARATMYRLLDEPATAEGVGVTLREIMSPQDLKMLLEGGGGVKGDMIAMFAKYFGNAATKRLPSETTPAAIDNFAKQIIRMKDRMGRRIDDPFFSPEDIPFAHGGLAHILQVPRRGRVVHPGGYAGISKRQKFINLAKAGGSRQDFIDLANSFKSKSLDAPFTLDEELMMILGGGMDAPLKHGGLARILEV